MVESKSLRMGRVLMLIGSLSFVVYGLVFFFRSFSGEGFELGVETIGGLTQADLNQAVVHYIMHLHIATAAFIIATGVAVAALSWYGVKKRERWAWVAAVVSPVIGLGLALPMHYLGMFEYSHATHLGPIYLGTLIFVIGAVMTAKDVFKR